MRTPYQLKNVQIFAIRMDYYLYLCSGLLKALSWVKKVYFFFFFHLDKAKTNYSASHVSTFSLCLIKIAYAVALSMLLMTPWWILD